MAVPIRIPMKQRFGKASPSALRHFDNGIPDESDVAEEDQPKAANSREVVMRALPELAG